VLRPGDRVALFAPSSHQGKAPQDLLVRARDILVGWGLRPDPLAPERRHLYLAGTDAERAAEFERLYLDPEVKALFCTRGGYGSARILPLLHRARIAAAAPKPVVGFSDLTALFAWLHWAAGIATVHGPGLAAPSALDTPGAAASLEALRRVLFDPQPPPALPARLIHRPGPAAGSVTGRLVGGCLSVLVTTLGTPWAPGMRGAILFLEDTEEAPFRIDRMLTHLRQAGKLDGLRAVVFGHLRRCDSDPPGLLEQVLRDVFRAAPFPVATGLPAGHGDPNLPLLLGQMARLDFDAGSPDATATARLQMV
jgi:muramoyltetrapeptide carboxypeptidase